MVSSSYRGGDSYGAAPYRSREGLSTRLVAGSDDFQVRIDPMHGDLDDEITGLRKQVRNLRNQMTLIKPQAGVKNNMRRLNIYSNFRGLLLIQVFSEDEIHLSMTSM